MPTKKVLQKSKVANDRDTQHILLSISVSDNVHVVWSLVWCLMLSYTRQLFLAGCSAPDQICIHILQATFPEASPPVLHYPYQICNSINSSEIILKGAADSRVVQNNLG